MQLDDELVDDQPASTPTPFDPEIEDFGSPRVKRRRLSEIAAESLPAPTGLMFGFMDSQQSDALPTLHTKLAFPPTEMIGGGQSAYDEDEDDEPLASTSAMTMFQGQSPTSTRELDSFFPSLQHSRGSYRPPQWFNEPIRDYTPEEVEEWRNQLIDRKEQEVSSFC